MLLETIILAHIITAYCERHEKPMAIKEYCLLFLDPLIDVETEIILKVHSGIGKSQTFVCKQILKPGTAPFRRWRHTERGMPRRAK